MIQTKHYITAGFNRMAFRVGNTGTWKYYFGADSLSDLASQLGGLKPGGNLTSWSEIDNYKDSGAWAVHGGLVPSGIAIPASSTGTLCSIKTNGTSYGTRQLFISNSGSIYTRLFLNDERQVWDSWRTGVFDCMTSSDLASLLGADYHNTTQFTLVSAGSTKDIDFAVYRIVCGTPTIYIFPVSNNELHIIGDSNYTTRATFSVVNGKIRVTAVSNTAFTCTKILPL